MSQPIIGGGTDGNVLPVLVIVLPVIFVLLCAITAWLALKRMGGFVSASAAGRVNARGAHLFALERVPGEGGDRIRVVEHTAGRTSQELDGQASLGPAGSEGSGAPKGEAAAAEGGAAKTADSSTPCVHPEEAQAGGAEEGEEEEEIVEYDVHGQPLNVQTRYLAGVPMAQVDSDYVPSCIDGLLNDIRQLSAPLAIVFCFLVAPCIALDFLYGKCVVRCRRYCCTRMGAAATQAAAAVRAAQERARQGEDAAIAVVHDGPPPPEVLHAPPPPGTDGALSSIAAESQSPVKMPRARPTNPFSFVGRGGAGDEGMGVSTHRADPEAVATPPPLASSRSIRRAGGGDVDMGISAARAALSPEAEGEGEGDEDPTPLATPRTRRTGRRVAYSTRAVPSAALGISAASLGASTVMSVAGSNPRSLDSSGRTLDGGVGDPRTPAGRASRRAAADAYSINSGSGGLPGSVGGGSSTARSDMPLEVLQSMDGHLRGEGGRGEAPLVLTCDSIVSTPR